jgi:enoyl-CoA hydratase/carnithine racemase
VERERHDRVMVIRMNRPDKRNAINETMSAGLDAALNEFEDDPDLWVGILAGHPKAFSAGTDLRDGPGEPTARGGEYGVIRRRRSKPLIAAVEGAALGGGMEIVLACDLVVAARSATFGLPEPRRGVIATCGGLFRTHRALPLNVAKQMLLTGEPLTAQRAYEIGLVNELVDEGSTVPAALTLASQICENAPVSVRESLTALERMNSGDDERAWQVTADAIATTFASEDTAEGIAAFFERREPRWRGR